MNATFREPAPLTLELAVEEASSWPGKHNGMLRRCSPEEEHHAFVLSTDRDLSVGKNVEGWVAAWKSCVARMVKITSYEAIFWQAAKARERIGEQFDCLYYSTVLWQK